MSSLVIISSKEKGNKIIMHNAHVLRSVEFRPPSGAINKAVLSPVRIESPFRFQLTGACLLRTRKGNSQA